MTESGWLRCKDPAKMWNFVLETASDRKLRLFACACCHRIWPVLTDERSRRAVELAERSADDFLAQRNLAHASGEAEDAFADMLPGDPDTPALSAATAASYASGTDLRHFEITDITDAAARAAPDGETAETAAQAALMRDIFGNPFRPVVFDPSWLTGNVRDLAQAVYDDRAFDRLPILADALLDAGCDGEAILSHCRSEGPHVRGCWVVDLILGKK